MKKFPVLLSLSLLVPAGAGAAEGVGPGVAGSLAQMIGSLLLVIGIILILYYLAGKFMKIPQGGASRYIRVVETRHLAPKKSLVLIEVGGEYLLLSNSEGGLGLLKQVEVLEEIDVVDERAYTALIPAQLRKRLNALAGGVMQPEPQPVAQLQKSGGIS